MLGLTMGFLVVLIVPAVGLIKLALNNWNWRLLIQPTPAWGPKERQLSSATSNGEDAEKSFHPKYLINATTNVTNI